MFPTIDREWVADQISRNINRVLNPSVCYRALVKMKRPDSDFREIAEILAGDPFISAKVIAMAELARRQPQDAEDAPATRIVSIDRAVGLLGVRQVEALVLAVMLAGPLASRPFLIHRPDVWRYIFGCAAAGDWLIPRLHPRNTTQDSTVSEYLVSGLTLGLGIQLLYAGLGTAYSRVLGPRIRPIMLAQRERRDLGVDHHQVTAWALEAMHCPDDLGRYAAMLARQQDDAPAAEARAIELLGCRAAGFETTRSVPMLRGVLEKLRLAHLAAEADDALAALRLRVRQLATAFRVDLAMSDEQREQLHRQTTRRAGEQMAWLLERDVRRRPGHDAA